MELYKHLKVMCSKNKISFIDHRNTITVSHLNGSKLHLKLKGNNVLTNTFAVAVSNTLH